MRRLNKKKTNSKSRKPNLTPLAVGAAGAAVGAGVAVAASAALSNKNTRKKVGKVMEAVREQAADYVEGLQTQRNIEKGKKAVRQVVATARKNMKSNGIGSSSPKSASKKTGERSTTRKSASA